MDKRSKILIIDDEQDIRYTISEICKLDDYQIMLAKSGEEGYQIACDFQPDLVISDYHMPGWDGIKTVRALNQLDQNMAVLVLTIDERQEIADKFMAVGATDFAIKPIKAPDLLARIKVNLNIKAMQDKMSTDNQKIFVEKGISSATLNIITRYLQGCQTPVSLNEISAGVNLAYQTIHRYVNYLTESGKVEVHQIYGKLGRPKNRYTYRT